MDYLDLLVSAVVKTMHDWHSAVIFSFCLLVLGAALHRCDYKPRWPRRLYKSIATNIGFWCANLLFAPILYITYSAIKTGFSQLGLPHVATSTWEGAPFWSLVLLSALCVDFADYWNHRAMHHKWLWPVHAVHHSDTALNPLSTYRVHFLEPFIMRLSYLPIIGFLGLPVEAVAFGALFFSLHNMYVHIMVDWDHGPFKYALASPRMHQWHHADTPEAHGKNLANVFPIYDLLFGTFYVPGPCIARHGASGVPENDIVKLCLHPFAQWTRWGLQIVPLIQKRKAASEPPVVITPPPPRGAGAIRVEDA